jgi:hypothetical protein
MRRLLALGLAAAISFGCGTHRITYLHSAAAPNGTYEQDRTHGHGFGPLLIGGGGYFGVVDELSPALIDYNGAENLANVCPYGFTQVSHHFAFWQSAVAAVISWAIIFNAYHPSSVEMTCVSAPPPTALAPQPAPSPPALDPAQAPALTASPAPRAP